MYNKITLHNNCKDMGGGENHIGFGFLLLRFFVSLIFWSKTGETGVLAGWVPARETQVNKDKGIYFFLHTA